MQIGRDPKDGVYDITGLTDLEFEIIADSVPNYEDGYIHSHVSMVFEILKETFKKAKGDLVARQQEALKAACK